MNKGKCELNTGRDCAWVLIYKEAEKKQAPECNKSNTARTQLSKGSAPSLIDYQ